MTVISTLITARCTAHATDSLITELQPDGSRMPIDWKKPKIVPVRRFRGAISYWGLAGIHGGWSTLEWLTAQVQNAVNSPSPEDFAQELARRLQQEITGIAVATPIDRGIGLHFTAYECVGDRWIPELFLVSNWQDPSYTAIRPTGVGYSRETLASLDGRGWQPDDRRADLRILVSQFLHGEGVYQGRGKGLFRYNNGDPSLYNPPANAIQGMLTTMAERRWLKALGVSEAIQLARRPVEVVSEIQRDFCRADRRIVGGKIHDLAITPGGRYASSSRVMKL